MKGGPHGSQKIELMQLCELCGLAGTKRPRRTRVGQAAAHQPDYPIPSRVEPKLVLEDLPFPRLACCCLPVCSTHLERYHTPRVLSSALPPVCPSCVLVNLSTIQPTGLSPKFPFRGASIPRGNKTHPLGFYLYPPCSHITRSTGLHDSSLLVTGGLLARDQLLSRHCAAILSVLLASLPVAACATDPSISLDFVLHHTWQRYWRQGRPRNATLVTPRPRLGPHPAERPAVGHQPASSDVRFAQTSQSPRWTPAPQRKFTRCRCDPGGVSLPPCVLPKRQSLMFRVIVQNPKHALRPAKPVQGQRQPAEDEEMGRGQDAELRR